MIVNDQVALASRLPFQLRCDRCRRGWFYHKASDLLVGLVAAADAGWTITLTPTVDGTVADRHYCPTCTRKGLT